MITTIIICTIIALAINFVSVWGAMILGLKVQAKQLSAIIDECEKEDKSELFVKNWTKHNR